MIAFNIFSVIALALATSVSAKKKSWEKAVNHKCVTPNQVAMTISGKVNKEMITLVERAHARQVKGLHIFVDTDDFAKDKRHKRRNAEFLQKVSKEYGYTFGVYATKDLSKISKKKMGKKVSKMTKPLRKVLGASPLTIALNKKSLNKTTTKNLNRHEYIMVGNMQAFSSTKAEDAAFEKKSFVIGSTVCSPREFGHKVRAVFKAGFELVDMATCLGRDQLYNAGASASASASGSLSE